jgi:hypothetical protein
MLGKVLSALSHVLILFSFCLAYQIEMRLSLCLMSYFLLLRISSTSSFSSIAIASLLVQLNLMPIEFPSFFNLLQNYLAILYNITPSSWELSLFLLNGKCMPIVFLNLALDESL